MNVLQNLFFVSLAVSNLHPAFGFAPNSMIKGPHGKNEDHTCIKATKHDGMLFHSEKNVSATTQSRRNFVGSTAAMVALSGMTPSAGAASGIASVSDGNLPDLPSEAVRAYLQYRIPLQVAADFYVFALQDMIGDIDQWGEVGQLYRVNNNKGQGQPSKIGTLPSMRNFCQKKLQCSRGYFDYSQSVSF